MKRSRIFLGLTTACLAIAGVVAAKVSHFADPIARWYFKPATNQCLPTSPVTCKYDQNAQNICTYVGFRVYTQKNTLGNCVHTLVYNEF